ncbi:unnamed protein product [Arctogadus glacialis]
MSGPHLDEWQRRSFDISSGTCTPEQKADAFRAHMLSIQYAWASSQLSRAGADSLLGTFSERYAAVLDSDDPHAGLNNYAESALHLARSQRNHSDKWESSLTAGSVLELACVQRMIQAGTEGRGGGGGGGSRVEPADVNICVGQEGRGSIAPLFKSSGAEVSRTTEGSNTAGRAPGGAAEGSGRLPACGPSLFGQAAPGNSGLAVAAHNPPSAPFPPSDAGKRKSFYNQTGETSGDASATGTHRGRSGSETRAAAGGNFRSAREQFIGPPLSLCRRCRGPRKRRAGPASTATESPRSVDERLKNFEPKIIELIMSEIMDHGPPVAWDDIAGLEYAKATIKEIVVWPMLRPDIFTGLRGPPKGILLFGPPGTGKTLIGKCIACQSGATFFSISASSLTSKWVGDGEKMVRALFAIARCHQPAVIFIDEIDSLLSQRTDGEHDSSRRIKTEFLVQLDGASTAAEDRVLVVGATNRPHEIDEAARRRLSKRLYIPLPEAAARRQIIASLMARERNELGAEELEGVVAAAEGFSGADMTQLCREAALGPIRSIQLGDIATISAEQVRPILYRDFQDALRAVRPSVSPKDLELYEDWNRTFGCGR